MEVENNVSDRSAKFKLIDDYLKSSNAPQLKAMTQVCNAATHAVATTLPNAWAVMAEAERLKKLSQSWTQPMSPWTSMLKPMEALSPKVGLSSVFLPKIGWPDFQLESKSKTSAAASTAGTLEDFAHAASGHLRVVPEPSIVPKILPVLPSNLKQERSDADKFVAALKEYSDVTVAAIQAQTKAISDLLEYSKLSDEAAKVESVDQRQESRRHHRSTLRATVAGVILTAVFSGQPYLVKMISAPEKTELVQPVAVDVNPIQLDSVINELKGLRLEVKRLRRDDHRREKK